MNRRKLIQRLARDRGLSLVGAGDLKLRRQRCGRGFRFIGEDGKTIRNKATLARLRSLAVPPAYQNVHFAADPQAHLQAIGEDAAGRTQYRYHPQWQEVLEAAKSERLADLARALPDIQKAVRRRLARRDDSLDYVTAAVVHLVETTALRAGGESYARERGTRGATTLLKSNVQIDGKRLSLRFRAKGSKLVVREVDNRRLAAALERMLALPGCRLFQHRKEDGTVRPVRASDVNAFLREVSGRQISLKDFRTMLASVGVLETLAATKPGTSDRTRRSQVRSAVAAAAEELSNTPTVCRTSYVHDSVVAAFERGALPRLVKQGSSPAERVATLGRIVTRHG
ncbi:MAG: DNA topoisomerase IB [Reyranella sp.]|nr:DNA topoisomerase IB [Reyranella sp.]